MWGDKQMTEGGFVEVLVGLLWVGGCQELGGCQKPGEVLYLLRGFSLIFQTLGQAQGGWVWGPPDPPPSVSWMGTDGDRVSQGARKPVRALEGGGSSH